VADDLTISGGGFSAVATADLFEQAMQLERMIEGIEACLARLSVIDRALDAVALREWNARYSAFNAEARIDDATTALRLAGMTARSIRLALGASAEAYGAAEGILQGLSQVLAAKFAHALGFIFPGLAVLFAPTLGSTAITGMTVYALMPDERRKALLRWLMDQNEVLTNPQVVTLVRLGVMSSDDFAGGVMRLSPQLAGLLGDEGWGLLGLTASAGLLTGVVAPLGPLAETPVRVNRVSTRTDTRTATTFAERAARIPQGGSQIRIDRLHVAGGPDRFEVYLGGTRDFSPLAAAEPWDMTSNVHSLSMGDAGSYRAAQEAMRLAGIDSDSPVQFAGHSQGALVASALASSGDYNAQGLFTVGGVVSQDLVPDGVPWLAIEHTDDLIPALAGNRIAPETVLVRRQVFGGEEVPSDTVLPAHELRRYRETAAMLDDTDDGRSGPLLVRLNRLGAGVESVTTTRYLARRIAGP
jgi:hypothetical protein